MGGEYTISSRAPRVDDALKVLCLGATSHSSLDDRHFAPIQAVGEFLLGQIERRRGSPVCLTKLGEASTRHLGSQIWHNLPGLSGLTKQLSRLLKEKGP